MKKTKVNLSYILRLYGSESKFEDLRWSSYQYTKLTNAFINHLYFKPNVRFFSTKGFGVLGNQAQQKALGIVKSKKTNEEENNHKKSVPVFKKQECFAHIKSNHLHLISIIELILVLPFLKSELKLVLYSPKVQNL